jgi:aspartate aminotransferase
VITHQPYWPTIVEQIKLSDATPVAVMTSPKDGFAIHADAILEAVTPKTRGIIINSPCNPTGALISESEFRRIAEYAGTHDIWLTVDLCYEKLIYDPVAHNLPKILAELCPDNFVICGSASKAYAMTGWRCGWTVGPAKMVAACNALQSHATSNVNSITQKAVVEALNGIQTPVKTMLDEYRTRRDNLYGWLTSDPRIKCLKPAGAFYMFPDISEAMAAGGFKTSIDFAQALLDEKRVAVTPGEAFDSPGFIRMSYATSMDNLKEGSRRLVEFVQSRTLTTHA